MFYSQQIKRGDGLWQTNLFLTQGDIAVLTAEPVFENLDYDASDISSITFILSNADMVQEYSKTFTNNNDGTYGLTLDSEDTDDFSIGMHNYEIVYTFDDDNVFTSNTGIVNILAKSTSAGE